MTDTTGGDSCQMSRRMLLAAVVLAVMMICASPVLACTFPEIPIATDWSGKVTGWTTLVNGTSTSVNFEGFTECFPVYEIGIRLSLYRYDGGVLRFVNSKTSSHAGDIAFLNVTWTSTHPGCWHGHGYHWAMFGGGVQSCATLNIWHMPSGRLGELHSGGAPHAPATYASKIDRQAIGIGSDWHIVGFEDFDSIVRLVGDRAGRRLAHYLYVTGARHFELQPGDLLPAVYISPCQTEAVVGMFGPAARTATLISLSMDEAGNWVALRRTSLDMPRHQCAALL